MLYTRPDIYDALYNRFQDDIPFYLALADETAGPVCELACGTGRVTVPLAQGGHEVMAIDSSSAMLAAAEQRARDAAVPAGRILFAEGDMRSPPDDGRFGLVIIPLHSLSHLYTNEDVIECLEGVRRSLRPEGRLAFAVHNPDPAVLARDPDDVARIHREQATISAYESSSYDTVTQRLDLRWFVETPEGTERFDYAIRLFFPQELRALLHCTGFVVENRFGWYDRSPFTGESGTQVIIARR
jgi:SAM-dependent methyltransferase